jgi:hypothetical protein
MGIDRTPEFSASPSMTVGRQGAHNASVDEVRRSTGACAQVHLPTGRMCTKRHSHDGSCEFVTPDQVEASLARHRAAEGW